MSLSDFLLAVQTHTTIAFKSGYLPVPCELVFVVPGYQTMILKNSDKHSVSVEDLVIQKNLVV